MRSNTSYLTRRSFVGGIAASSLSTGAFAQGADIPLTIAVSSNSLAYGGLRIAELADLFKKNGIAAKIVVMDSGNTAMAALVSGSAQFSAAGPGEVLAARLRGQKIVIVANVYRGLSGSLLLAKAVAEKLGDAAKAGQAAKIKALDGLTIASPSATSAYLTPYKSATEAVGAKIKFVYMAQPAMVAALATGAIQGMIAGAPFSLAPVASGTGVLWLDGPKGELPKEVLPASSSCYETTEDYAAKNPDHVKRLQAVFDDLATFIAQKPAEAKAMLAKSFSQLSPADASAVFDQEAPNWSRPRFTVEDVKQEISIQVSSGNLPGVEKIDPAALLVK